MILWRNGASLLWHMKQKYCPTCISTTRKCRAAETCNHSRIAQSIITGQDLSGVTRDLHFRHTLQVTGKVKYWTSSCAWSSLNTSLTFGVCSLFFPPSDALHRNIQQSSPVITVLPHQEAVMLNKTLWANNEAPCQHTTVQCLGYWNLLLRKTLTDKEWYSNFFNIPHNHRGRPICWFDPLLLPSMENGPLLSRKELCVRPAHGRVQGRAGKDVPCNVLRLAALHNRKPGAYCLLGLKQQAGLGPASSMTMWHRGHVTSPGPVVEEGCPDR